VLVGGTPISNTPICGLRGKLPPISSLSQKSCLNVVGMSRVRTIGLLDQYEQAIDEVVAACDGDVRDALRALMALNERLELQLERVSAALGQTEEDAPPRTLH